MRNTIDNEVLKLKDKEKKNMLKNKEYLFKKKLEDKFQSRGNEGEILIFETLCEVNGYFYVEVGYTEEEVSYCSKC